MGAVVGDDDGLTVGDVLGTAEGRPDGDADGDAVGCGVGGGTYRASSTATAVTGPPAVLRTHSART